METTKRDLEFYRKNAEEDYSTTPISVLRYITVLEERMQALRIEQSEQPVCPNCSGEGFSGKGTNEILPCLSCFGSGKKVD